MWLRKKKNIQIQKIYRVSKIIGILEMIQGWLNRKKVSVFGDL